MQEGDEIRRWNTTLESILKERRWNTGEMDVKIEDPGEGRGGLRGWISWKESYNTQSKPMQVTEWGACPVFVVSLKMKCKSMCFFHLLKSYNLCVYILSVLKFTCLSRYSNFVGWNFPSISFLSQSVLNVCLSNNLI